MEQKILELINITGGNFLFTEYYPHTNKEMWKILNPYTKYGEEKFVLGSVSEGFEKSLDQAIETIKIQKAYFLNRQA